MDYGDDGIIPSEGGIDALKTALTTIGYDTSAPIDTYSATGLTHLQRPTHHDFLDDHVDELFTWIATIEAPAVASPTWHTVSADGLTLEGPHEFVGTVSADGNSLNTDPLEYVGKVDSTGNDWE